MIITTRDQGKQNITEDFTNAEYQKVIGVNLSGYATAKHGVVGLTRNSAIEYGEKGVVVNAIAPGAILTPMVEASLKQMGGEEWEATDREFVQPKMKHFGKPEELGALVAFLLSNTAGFVNGTVIPIDGGQHIKY